MTDFEESRQVWRKEFAVQSILWKCSNILPIVFDERRRDANSEIRNPDKFMTDFERYLQNLDQSNKSNILGLLKVHFEALSSGRKPSSALNQQIHELSKSHMNSLAKISSSLDKAKGSLMALIDIGDFESDQEYDAMCLLYEDFDQKELEKKIARIVVNWKDKLRHSLEDTNHNDIFLSRYIFWISYDFLETLDAISRYHFMEFFKIGDLPNTVIEIEEMFKLINEGYNPFDTWLASRSPKLCNNRQHYIKTALENIINQQNDEGWWPSQVMVDEYSKRYLPSNYLTALSCVDLLRLSHDEKQLERAKQGIQWLSYQQEVNGAWTDEIKYEKSYTKSSKIKNIVSHHCLLTTLLAAEAIKRSGLNGYESTLKKANQWIKEQQNPDGFWDNDFFPFPFMTILVVEFFEEKYRQYYIDNLDNRVFKGTIYNKIDGIEKYMKDGFDDLLKNQIEIKATIKLLHKDLLKHYNDNQKEIIRLVTQELDLSQTKTVIEIINILEAKYPSITDTELINILKDIKYVLSEIEYINTEDGTRDSKLKSTSERMLNLVDDPKLNLNHKLTLLFPIVPWLINYELDIELTNGLNLNEVVNNIWETARKVFR